MNEITRSRMQVAFVLSIIAFVVAAALMLTGDHRLVQWLSLASTLSVVMALGLLLRAGSRRD
jgi:uncharacterized protein (DUF983 family)